MRVSAQYVEDHIAELLIAASQGEEIEIALEGKPMLKLMRMNKASQLGRRVLGAGRGEMRVPTEEEWREMDQELERQMTREELMVPDQA